MSEENEQLPADASRPELPSRPDASAGGSADTGDVRPETQPVNPNGFDAEAYIAELKREAKKHRLTPEQLAAIRANLPPPEEEERMYREMQEGGALSAEEFFASLGIEIEP
jgi:hypothetical protein